MIFPTDVFVIDASSCQPGGTHLRHGIIVRIGGDGRHWTKLLEPSWEGSNYLQSFGEIYNVKANGT